MKSAERTGSESNPNSEDVSQKHKSDESDVPETIPGEEEQGEGRTGDAEGPSETFNTPVRTKANISWKT